MPKHKIICPYCFGEFMDDEVHFRMETVLTEDQLDSLNEQRTRSEIEMDSRFRSEEIKKQLADYDLREMFLPREDEKYSDFWAKFGGTTEKASVGRDGKSPTVMPYQRAVLNPKDPNHMQYFGQPANESDIVNENGLVYAAYDCFGKQTQRRVCPHCHNPLPGAYGKYPVKFISIIGIFGSGKTVFLSQLCKYIAEQLSYFDITATPTSIYAREYLAGNPVIMGIKLPTGTPPQQMQQPLCFDLVYRHDNEENFHTVVFYDIAGENCASNDNDLRDAVEDLHNFGPFIEHSDGIMLLIDPIQFNESSGKSQPVEVCKNIYNLFQHKNKDWVKNLPLAVCISKGDQVAVQLIHQNLDDVHFLQDNDGNYLPCFNSADYNPIHDSIKNFIRSNDNQLDVRLKTLYDNYNYFLFSAIGTSTKKMDNANLETPAGPPIPKRIIEPIVWFLLKFGFITSREEIHEPKDWICNTCGIRRRVQEQYCPKCKTNNKGEWKCPKCGTVQTGDWCSKPKCKTNCFGKRRGLFSR